MPLNVPTGMVTADDLDHIAEEAAGDNVPPGLRADLVRAVDDGRIADPADTGFALLLAAEAADRSNDLETAEALAERAARAYRDSDLDDSGARAYRGGLLLRLGRSDEGMAELTALRPRLLDDPEAVEFVIDALVDADRAEVAERWLTEAVDITLKRREALADDPDSEEFEVASLIAYGLLQERRNLRAELELPADDHDDLADILEAAVSQPNVLQFWPRVEHERVILRWPELAAVFGADWDAHRADLEKAMTTAAEMEWETPAVYVGSADGLASYAAERGSRADDPDILDGYLETLAARSPGLPWPPGRNDTCWCGSGTKYKRCCLPRARE